MRWADVRASTQIPTQYNLHFSAHSHKASTTLNPSELDILINAVFQMTTLTLSEISETRCTRIIERPQKVLLLPIMEPVKQIILFTEYSNRNA